MIKNTKELEGKIPVTNLDKFKIDEQYASDGFGAFHEAPFSECFWNAPSSGTIHGVFHDTIELEGIELRWDGNYFGLKTFIDLHRKL